MFKERRFYKDAASLYFRIASEASQRQHFQTSLFLLDFIHSFQESSLNAAVMLEQAAYCYLLSDPPFLRKYAFHLVLAGNRYYISEQVYEVLNK